MYAGEIIEQGTIEEIYDRSRVHHPYTVGLFGSIPDLTHDVDRLSPIFGLMPDPRDLPTGCKFHPRCQHCMEICKRESHNTRLVGTHMIRCHKYDSLQGDG